MKIKNVFPIVFCLIFMLAISQTFAKAPPPEYIGRPTLSNSRAKAVIYYPDPDVYSPPYIAVVAMHRTSNFLQHISTSQLPPRGFVVLAMNPRCDNNEATCTPWENNVLDVRDGVKYLRSLEDEITHQKIIRKVILLGHSGGGPTMSFYQAVAENGAAFCQESTKLVKCGNGHDDLMNYPADGIILMDAHPGNGLNALRSLNPAVTNDPAVTDQNRTPRINPSLDPFNPKNGYNPDGSSPYSNQFKEKYFKAQSDRMNFLIENALYKMEQIEAGTYRYPDDDAFIVPRGGARLMQLDLSIDHSTAEPRKLLKNDGTIEDCCKVESVRPVSLSPEDDEEFGSGYFLTVRSFLSVRAIRSNDSMVDIDWCSSNNSTPCNLQNVTIPLLVTAMGGHYFIRDSEISYEMAASPDKDFIVIEGATHGGTPCTNCTGGPYNNATLNLFNYMADWMNAKFPAP